MAEEHEAGSAGEMMVFGLIEQADRIGKSALATQRELAAQIGQLSQLQGRIEAALRNLDAERVQLQAVRPALQASAANAMRSTLHEQSAEIETLLRAAFGAPLRDIEQAAGYVRQNVKETRWLWLSLILAGGIVIGLALGWLPMRSSVNSLQAQVDRIEQNLAAQQAAPAAAEPSQASAHKGKK